MTNLTESQMYEEGRDAATQARAPRSFREPEPGTPWWQTAKDCGAWTDRKEGDIGYVHFGSVEALRVYTLKIGNQARAAAAPAAVPDETLLAIFRATVRGDTLKLTRDVGPYEVTEPTQEARDLAQAILAAAR